MVRGTLCVGILKMFEQHLATFKWQKLSEINELEKQSMTFSICVFGPKKLCGLFVDSYTTSPFTQAIICKSCFSSISRLAKLSTNSCHENSSMTGTATMTGIRPFQILLGNFLATFRILSNFFVREQLLATFRKTSTFLVTFWLF